MASCEILSNKIQIDSTKNENKIHTYYAKNDNKYKHILQKVIINTYIFCKKQ